MSIVIENLTKSYGSQKALDGVSLEIKSGQITGLLGPNGAGKSTLMKIITGSVIPDAGSVMVNGVDVLKEPLKVQRVLGYLPEHNPIFRIIHQGIPRICGFHLQSRFIQSEPSH